jgi:hypothetical protein
MIKIIKYQNVIVSITKHNLNSLQLFFVCLALTYELQLDKDKEQSDKRLLFRESYRSFKKRQIKLSQRVCHDYSLYMKVWNSNFMIAIQNNQSIF